MSETSDKLQASAENGGSRSQQRRGCAAPSDLEVAISQNLHICRKMKRSESPEIAAMGTFGESMMIEVEQLLPNHVAQHNNQAQAQPPTATPERKGNKQ